MGRAGTRTRTFRRPYDDGAPTVPSLTRAPGQGAGGALSY